MDKTLLYDELKVKYRQFQLNEKNFTDMVENCIVQHCDVENPDWKDYVKLQSNEKYSTIMRIRFFVDKPCLNYYGIIIEENNIQKHYSFNQDAMTNKEHVIKLTSDVSLLFNDELVDKIRAGDILCESRIRISYEMNNFPLLKLPFHIERTHLENANWIASILDKMDYQVYELFNKTKQKLKANSNTLSTSALYF